jgi:nucleoside-diphosphate-sugar epimerase
MNGSRVLVVGATGQLGGVITRKLVASGVRVRALARNPEALATSARRHATPAYAVSSTSLTGASRRTLRSTSSE